MGLGIQLPQLFEHLGGYIHTLIAGMSLNAGQHEGEYFVCLGKFAELSPLKDRHLFGSSLSGKSSGGCEEKQVAGRNVGHQLYRLG